MMKRPDPRAEPRPSARGYRIADFCQREGISRSTCWAWVRKGLLEVHRLGPQAGVRVDYAPAYREHADD
jgi:predicted site-specific integrase-resolvase